MNQPTNAPAMSDITTLLNDAWGWTGLVADAVLAENDFGNLLIADTAGAYWRLCPEDLRCEAIANSDEEFTALMDNQDFLHDWYMQDLADAARGALGALDGDEKFYLQVPAPLGGAYAIDNIGRITLADLIVLSGELAKRRKAQATPIDELLDMAARSR